MKVIMLYNLVSSIEANRGRVRRPYLVVNNRNYCSYAPYFNCQLSTIDYQLLGKDSQKGFSSPFLTVFVADCTLPFNS